MSNGSLVTAIQADTATNNWFNGNLYPALIKFANNNDVVIKRSAYNTTIWLTSLTGTPNKITDNTKFGSSPNFGGAEKLAVANNEI